MSSKFTAFDVSVGNCFLLELERSGPGTEPFRVLVDTGNNKTQVPKFLSQHFGIVGGQAKGANQPVVDVVTLTHTDADHIRGLNAVLQMPLTVRELWLPYLIAKNSYMMFRSPTIAANQIMNVINTVPPGEIAQATRKLTSQGLISSEFRPHQNEPDEDENPDMPYAPLLALGTALVHEFAQQLRLAELPVVEELDEEIHIEAIGDQFRQAEQTEDQWVEIVQAEIDRRWREERTYLNWLLWHDFSPHLRYFFENSRRLEMFAQHESAELGRIAMLAALLKAGETVKNATISAYNNQNGLYIRWFEYVDELVQPSEPQNSTFPIGVINARVKHVISPGIDPAHILALIPLDPSDIKADTSETNRTSLVLYAPETSRYPAVLLSADSDFTFTQAGPALTWTPAMLITAPHHGSDANGGLAGLYSRAYQQTNKLTSTWVRSDKQQMDQPPERPAQWYKDLDHSLGVKRYCTCCAGKPKSQAQPNHVMLNAKHRLWTSQSPVCTC